MVKTEENPNQRRREILPLSHEYEKSLHIFTSEVSVL